MRLIAYTLLTAGLLLGSCRKDVLEPRKVQQLDSHTTSRLNNIRFLNSQLAIAAGGDLYDRSTILKSVDGGYTWSAYSQPDAPKEMRGMGIAPDGTLYLSGVDGNVLVSVDNGSTWQFRRIDNWQFYQGGVFPTPDTGIFVTSTLQRQCSIVRIDKDFKIIDELSYAFGLNNIYMAGPSTGYVVGYGAVMKTTDKGRNWVFQEVKGDNFTAMDIHGSEIWMCGSNGGIFYTADAGEHWQTLRNGNNLSLPHYWLRAIAFRDGKNGWAVGDEGKLIYTNDGGRHWAEYTSFTNSNLRSIAIADNGDLLIAGDAGALFRIKP